MREGEPDWDKDAEPPQGKGYTTDPIADVARVMKL